MILDMYFRLSVLGAKLTKGLWTANSQRRECGKEAYSYCSWKLHKLTTFQVGLQRSLAPLPFLRMNSPATRRADVQAIITTWRIIRRESVVRQPPKPCQHESVFQARHTAS